MAYGTAGLKHTRANCCNLIVINRMVEVPGFEPAISAISP